MRKLLARRRRGTRALQVEAERADRRRRRQEDASDRAARGEISSSEGLVDHTTPWTVGRIECREGAALRHLRTKRLKEAVADAVILRLRCILRPAGRRLAFDQKWPAPADFEREEVAPASRNDARLLPDLVDDARCASAATTRQF